MKKKKKQGENKLKVKAKVRGDSSFDIGETLQLYRNFLDNLIHVFNEILLYSIKCTEPDNPHPPPLSVPPPPSVATLCSQAQVYNTLMRKSW